MNKAWHDLNRMPSKVSIKVRDAWHLEHEKIVGVVKYQKQL